MNGKGNLANMIAFIIALIAGYKGLASEHFQAWLGIVSFALTAVLSTMFTNGVFVSGWSKSLWVVTIAGIIIQMLDLTSTNGLLPPQVVTYTILGITTFINTFYKSYKQ